MPNRPGGVTDIVTMLAEGPVTILAGAGLSAPAPTCLPGWWTLNDAVLGALGHAVEEVTDRSGLSDSFRGVIQQRRNDTPFLKPDLQAQLIEDEIGSAYFTALAHVDSEEPNAAHALLAELTRLGRIGAIVTTNFDCTIERALDTAGVAYELFASPKEFEDLAGAGGSLALVKVHGSATRPETMVDTLRQRLHGRPVELEDWMLDRFVSSPTIALGFSCEDLQYNPDYLSIRPAIRKGARFTFLVREGSEPSSPLASLASKFTNEVRVSSGTLPRWLFDVASEANIEHKAPVPSTFTEEQESALRARALEKLEAGLDEWRGTLSPMDVINAVAALLSSAGRSSEAHYLLRRMWEFYRAPQDCSGPAYVRYLFNYGEALLRPARLHNPHDRETDPSTWKQAADTDPRQFFFRAVRNGGSDDALARLLLCKFLAGVPVPSFSDQAEILCDRIREAAKDGAALSTALIDATFSLTELMELLGLGQASPALHVVSHRSAVEIGDEFRRAEAAWRWARALAFSGDSDAANVERIAALAQESTEIAARLDIPESEAGAALARAVAASTGMDWITTGVEAKAAEDIYVQIGDELGAFFARRERLRALIAEALSGGDVDGSAFDELSEALQRFCVENVPGMTPLVKLELAWAAQHIDTKLAAELAGDARAGAERQQHPVIAKFATSLLESMAE